MKYGSLTGYYTLFLQAKKGSSRDRYAVIIVKDNAVGPLPTKISHLPIFFVYWTSLPNLRAFGFVLDGSHIIMMSVLLDEYIFAELNLASPSCL